MNRWTPATEGRDFEMSPLLQPLARGVQFPDILFQSVFHGASPVYSRICPARTNCRYRFA